MVVPTATVNGDTYVIVFWRNELKVIHLTLVVITDIVTVQLIPLY